LQHFFCHLVGDGVVLDTQDHLAELHGADGRVADGFVLAIQSCRQLAHNPVGCQFGVATDFGGRFEVVGHGGVVAQHASVVVGQAVLFDKALVARIGQFRQGAAQLFDSGVVDHHRQQVGR